MKIRKRTKIIMVCAVLVVLIMVFIVALNSSVNYKIMSHTEMLKNQIKGEYEIYTDSVFETVEVKRSWYSLSPAEWIFVVKLAPDSEIQQYQYHNGQFILMPDLQQQDPY